MITVEFLWPLIFFAFGLVLGSFLNALEYRLARSESIWRATAGGPARSQCPHCRAVLNTVDLFPVLSFALLRGKCRHCAQPISWQYPAVELAAGLLAAVMAWHFGVSWEAVAFAVSALVLLFIFVYDLKHQMILDIVTIPAIAAAIAAAVALGWNLQSAFVGAVIGAGFFALQFVASRGRWIGGGDIRLGALMGILLGWQQLLAALFLAYVGGALIAVALLARGRAGLQSRLPFGVFLTAATIVMILYGEEIIDWYIGLTFL